MQVRRALQFVFMAGSVLGCTGGFDALPEAVESGLPNEGSLAEASEPILIGGIACSSTVISPYWQLTAAHCVGQWANRSATLPFDACFVHPSSVRAGGAVRCEELAGVDTHGLQQAHDVALLHRCSQR